MKFVLVVLVVAVAIYLLIRVIERRGVSPRPPGPSGQREPRVTGPDDDPDFLRDLDKRRRQGLDDS